MASPMLGGIRDVSGAENDLNTVELARFALDEHNKKSNAGLEFSRVVKVKTQVVSGTMHHLTIEAVDASKKKSLLEAKVWEKPWENFRSLHEINHLGDYQRLRQPGATYMEGLTACIIMVLGFLS